MFYFQKALALGFSPPLLVSNAYTTNMSTKKGGELMGAEYEKGAGSSFALIVVLFILLIIIGASFIY